jgi:hypothetical protein
MTKQGRTAVRPCGYQARGKDAERLVLSGGGDVLIHGQVGEKGLDPSTSSAQVLWYPFTPFRAGSSHVWPAVGCLRLFSLSIWLVVWARRHPQLAQSRRME